LWLGLLAYCGLLVVRWNNPKPRYFIPVAPLLLLAVWEGLERASHLVRRPIGRGSYACLLWGLLGGIGIVNVGLYVTSVTVAQSKPFYASYHAGQCDELVDIAHYLKEKQINDRDVAVSYRYLNINRSRMNMTGMRWMHMLTGRQILLAPDEIGQEACSSNILTWVESEGVTYLVHRPPATPWRVWHFRALKLQEMVTGQMPGPARPFFTLYRIDEGKPVQLFVPDVQNWPRRVPQMK